MLPLLPRPAERRVEMSRGTTMVRKMLTTLIAVPLAILLAVFMVANRHAVTVSLDPFGSGNPALSATLPLFVIILVCLLVGVIAGGTAAWLNQSRWRRAGCASSARRSGAGLRPRSRWRCRRGAPDDPFSASRRVRPGLALTRSAIHI